MAISSARLSHVKKEIKKQTRLFRRTKNAKSKSKDAADNFGISAGYFCPAGRGEVSLRKEPHNHPGERLLYTGDELCGMKLLKNRFIALPLAGLM